MSNPLNQAGGCKMRQSERRHAASFESLRSKKAHCCPSWHTVPTGTAYGHRLRAPPTGTADGNRRQAPPAGTAYGHRLRAPPTGTAYGHRLRARAIAKIVVMRGAATSARAEDATQRAKATAAEKARTVVPRASWHTAYGLL